MILTVYSILPGEGLPEEVRRDDRPVYTDPEHTGSGCIPAEELRPVSGTPAPSAGWLSRLLWWVCWILGWKKNGERYRSAKKRVRKMTEQITERQADVVIAASPEILELVLRALRRKGFVVRRSRIGFLQAGEKIFLSQRHDHCGGCSHNCLLQNPGCGVGRDKARRGY